jgi:hypothetical protein
MQAPSPRPRTKLVGPGPTRPTPGYATVDMYIAGNLQMTSSDMNIVPRSVKEQLYHPSSLRPTLAMVSVDTVRDVSRVVTARPLVTAGPVHEKDPP